MVRPFFRAIIIITLLGALWPSHRAQAAAFDVDRTDDSASATACTAAPNDCSLRGAVITANATPGADVITIPAGTYFITLTGSGEDGALTGDFDLTEAVTINGAGAASTILDGQDFDRLFHVINAITINLSNVTVTHGAEGLGGGMLIDSPGAVVTVSNSVFADNAAAVDGGGGISNGGAGGLGGGALNIVNSTFTNNQAPFGFGGGGVLARGGVTNISGSVFSGNQASEGGGLASRIDGGPPTVTINDSTFASNSATNGGGLSSQGDLTINRSTFSGNQAATNGGGMRHSNGTASLLNSTFSGNNAVNGGGIYYRGDVAMTLASVTIANNSVSTGDGGGFFYEPSTGADAAFGNTILAGNTDAGGQAPECAGQINSQDFNLIQNIAGCTVIGVTTNNLTGISPNLGPLANNGGPTLTHALLAGSPAIDSGTTTTCPATDQRGIARPLDGDGDTAPECDRGAFEAPAVATSTPTNTATNTPTVTTPPVSTSTPTTTAIPGNTATPGPTSVPPTPAPPSGGGCDPWMVMLPSGSAPNGSVARCDNLDPNTVAGAPVGFRLLRHPVHITVFAPNGASLAQFPVPIQVCYSVSGYTEAEVTQAGGDPNNFAVLNAPVDGAWGALPTTIDPNTRRACASVSDLNQPRFEISARVPTTLPTTGGTPNSWGWMWIVGVAFLSGGLVSWRLRVRRSRW